jgi:hypothetical protein
MEKRVWKEEQYEEKQRTNISVTKNIKAGTEKESENNRKFWEELIAKFPLM